jgi:asparagine synthase (glutamine-hydrolysing)
VEELLLDEIEKAKVEAILFSGGIDTSLLASLAFRDEKLPLVTMILREGEGPDLEYSTSAAKYLGAEQHIRYFDRDEAIEAAKRTIGVLKRFDPDEIRNDLVIQLGLEFCKEMGLSRVMTGDGADELFAGYGFLLEMPLERIDSWIRMSWSNWRFASKDLAYHMNMQVVQPFLGCHVIEYGIRVPVVYKALDDRGELVGKYVLRKLLADYLPPRLAMRDKSAIEYGSGANMLSDLFSELVTDSDFAKLRKRHPFRNREQAFYFSLFDDMGLEIPPAGEGENPCPVCGAPTCRSFCKICGTFSGKN